MKGDAEFTVIHTVILIIGDSGRQVFIIKIYGLEKFRRIEKLLLLSTFSLPPPQLLPKADHLF